MKKSLLLLAGALVAGASVANAATVYFDNTDNWSEVYVYTWTGSDQNHEWPGEAVTETVTNAGKTYYKYETDYAQIIFNNKDGKQTKDCNVVDKMIYDPSGATGNLFGGGSVEIVAECYLSCESNNWSASSEADKFTNNGNGTFTLTKASFDEEFKVVYDGEWLGYVDGKMASGVEYALSNTGYANCALTGAATNVTFVFNAEAKSLKVTYTTEGGDDPNPPTPPTGETPSKLYLIGGEIDGSSWNPAKAVAMTKNGNVFSCTATVKGVSEGICYFSFLTAIGEGSEEDPWAVANNADRYGATAADTPLEVGGSSAFMCYPVNVSASSAASWALTVDEAVLDFVVNFDTMTISVTNHNGDDPNPPTPPVSDMPSALYLIGGEINGYSWNPSEVVEMTKNGNVFSCSATVKGNDEGNVYFSFLTTKGADWDEVNGADRYGATEADAPISLGVASPMMCYPVNVSASAAASWKLELAEESVLDFAVDFTTMTVTVSKNSTAVSSIYESEAPVYFNLQGVKVAEPANGIYVKVVNGKASKVMIKK